MFSFFSIFLKKYIKQPTVKNQQDLNHKNVKFGENLEKKEFFAAFCTYILTSNLLSLRPKIKLMGFLHLKRFFIGDNNA